MREQRRHRDTKDVIIILYGHLHTLLRFKAGKSPVLANPSGLVQAFSPHRTSKLDFCHTPVTHRSVYLPPSGIYSCLRCVSKHLKTHQIIDFYPDMLLEFSNKDPLIDWMIKKINPQKPIILHYITNKNSKQKLI